MRTYYFVGGPTAGNESVFFHRLTEVGGLPSGWQIHPHATGDGQALQIVEVEGEEAIVTHLDQFGSIYQRGPIVEVAPRPRQSEQR